MDADGPKVGQLGSQPINVLDKACPDDHFRVGGELATHIEKEAVLAGFLIVAAVDEGGVGSALDKPEQALENALHLVNFGNPVDLVLVGEFVAVSSVLGHLPGRKFRLGGR